MTSISRNPSSLMVFESPSPDDDFILREGGDVKKRPSKTASGSMRKISQTKISMQKRKVSLAKKYGVSVDVIAEQEDGHTKEGDTTAAMSHASTVLALIFKWIMWILVCGKF